MPKLLMLNAVQEAACCLCGIPACCLQLGFDFEEVHQETQTKLVGKRKIDEVVGVGGEEGPRDSSISTNFSDLKEKPLGHTWSILFWTQDS